MRPQPLKRPRPVKRQRPTQLPRVKRHPLKLLRKLLLANRVQKMHPLMLRLPLLEMRGTLVQWRQQPRSRRLQRRARVAVQAGGCGSRCRGERGAATRGRRWACKPRGRGTNITAVWAG